MMNAQEFYDLGCLHQQKGNLQEASKDKRDREKYSFIERKAFRNDAIRAGQWRVEEPK